LRPVAFIAGEYIGGGINADVFGFQVTGLFVKVAE